MPAGNTGIVTARDAKGAAKRAASIMGGPDKDSMSLSTALPPAQIDAPTATPPAAPIFAQAIPSQGVQEPLEGTAPDIMADTLNTLPLDQLSQLGMSEEEIAQIMATAWSPRR